PPVGPEHRLSCGRDEKRLDRACVKIDPVDRTRKCEVVRCIGLGKIRGVINLPLESFPGILVRRDEASGTEAADKSFCLPIVTEKPAFGWNEVPILVAEPCRVSVVDVEPVPTSVASQPSAWTKHVRSRHFLEGVIIVLPDIRKFRGCPSFEISYANSVVRKMD